MTARFWLKFKKEKTFISFPFFVPRTGFEPAHPCERCHLKAVRLPISPSGHYCQGCKYRNNKISAKKLNNRCLPGFPTNQHYTNYHQYGSSNLCCKYFFSQHKVGLYNSTYRANTGNDGHVIGTNFFHSCG
jgi:hypothetical protein